MVNKLHPNFVIDKNHIKKAVILSYEEFQKIVEDLEELEDIRAYDLVKEKSQQILSFDDVVSELNINQ